MDEFDFLIVNFGHHAHMIDHASAICFEENQIAFSDIVFIQFTADFSHIHRRSWQSDVELFKGAIHQT